jgi:aminoglycoside phosphotransferase family enzyme
MTGRRPNIGQCIARHDAGPRLNGPRRGLVAKVAFLKQPASYPQHPGRVVAMETHMSWVFLADGRAYKLKKPLRYDHLDFGTIAARRRYCLAEIRLNRRLAPDAYLAALPLGVNGDGHSCLGGRRRIVDWLVEMRRLPESRTLLRRIRRHALDSADVGRLGDFFFGAQPVRIAPHSYRAASRPRPATPNGT